jgi:hypothetical protein
MRDSEQLPNLFATVETIGRDMRAKRCDQLS